MTDISYDPSDPTSQEEVNRLSPGIRSALDGVGAAIHAKNVAETRVAELERDLAIERAGIPDIPAKELFIKVYDGEATTEAVRTAAARYGLLNADGSAPANTGNQFVPASKPGDVPLDTALTSAADANEVMRIVREAGIPEHKPWQ